MAKSIPVRQASFTMPMDGPGMSVREGLQSGDPSKGNHHKLSYEPELRMLRVAWHHGNGVEVAFVPVEHVRLLRFDKPEAEPKA